MTANGSTPIFQYFAYEPYTDANGNTDMMLMDGSASVPGTTSLPNPDPLPDSSGLSATNAPATAEVMINLVVGGAGHDHENTSILGTATPLTDSVVFRFTPVANTSGGRHDLRTMRMTSVRSIFKSLRAIRRRLASEDGFTMVVALGVLMVTSLLIGAVYVAVDGGVQQSQRDLNGQRAYYAARAGENAFLYQLNQNPNFWSTCSNDYQPTPTAVPGSSTGGMYSFVPVYNSGYSNSTCTSANAISALIDTNTGSLRIEFTGYSGPPNASGTPERAAHARRELPQTKPARFPLVHRSRDGRPAAEFQLHRREVLLPVHPLGSVHDRQQLRDQLDHRRHDERPDVHQRPVPDLLGRRPVFGRSGSDDQIESSAPESSVCVSNSCQQATFNGQGAVAGAAPVPLPQSVSSTQLLADANTSSGQVFTGTTTINLTGGGAGTHQQLPGFDLIGIVHHG